MFTPKKVISAMEGTGGIKTTIAANLGCNRKTVDRYIERYPTVKDAYDEECDRVGDIVESNIVKKCRDGDVTMLIFYAKTKLKNRGYIEKNIVQNEFEGETGVLVVPGMLADKDWIKTFTGKEPEEAIIDEEAA